MDRRSTWYGNATEVCKATRDSGGQVRLRPLTVS
jgi:hypothetical protein